MTSTFLFVSTAGWIVFAVFLLSLMFCASWALVGWSRRFKHAEREAANYRDEITALRDETLRLRREGDLFNAIADVFIEASAVLQRERDEQERDHG